MARSLAGSDATQIEVGVIGLGVTGRNVAQHLSEGHCNVAAFDWGRQNTMALREQAIGLKVRVAANVSELMANLHPPRTILTFSGSDAPMNLVLDQVLPELEHGDLLMDAGDSYFKDTARHRRQLEERRIQFMGIGLGGGEKGARHGAIVMAGGRREVRHQTRPLLEAMAATIRDEPCVSYFETAEAAHYVKMVHAGIEYAHSQLLSESFDLLQRTLSLTEEELLGPSGEWRIGVLKEYLMEVSGRIVEPEDKPTLRLWLAVKLESARNDALGKWVAQSAWELEVPIPTMEAAAAIQHVAATERWQALVAAPFRQPVGRLGDDSKSVLDQLHSALHAAMMITYAQGMALLNAASKHHGFQFNLPEISRAWRGCTRLRTPLLDDIANALQATPDLPGLLSDADLSERVMAGQENLRRAVWRAHELDSAVPALLASLDYLDSSREAWLPVNLSQPPRRQPGQDSGSTDTR